MSEKFALKAAALALAASFLAVPASAAETYWFDQGHTEIIFGWKHAGGVSTQHGEFTKASGKLSLDPENVENSSIDVTIDTTSIATGFEPLDKHLKSADFLEVETYPEIKFKSTAVKRTGKDTADVTGDLTIHGVTQPVTLKTTLTHRGPHPVAEFIDYYKGQWVGFAATTEIDHQAFKVGNFSTGNIFIEINTEMKDREN